MTRLDDVKALVELFPNAVAALSVSGDTPWSRLIELSVAACGMSLDLVPEGSVVTLAKEPTSAPGGYG